MTAYAGMTVPQLEAAVASSGGDATVAASVLAELRERKQRRERQQKTERSKSAELRRRLEAASSDRSGTAMPVRSPHPPLASPPSTRFQPTAEQESAVEAFRTGEDVKISAFAGSGKTSTLSLLAAVTPRRGIYTAFNRDSTRDAAEHFGTNVRCHTLHSLAFRSMAGRVPPKKLTGKLSANLLVDELKLKPLRLDEATLTRPQVAGLALATIRAFAHGRAETPEEAEVPEHGVTAALTKKDRERVHGRIREVAAAAWERMQDVKHPLPLGHDGYLKLWALGRPSLPADFILLDEAQDTNDVVLELLENQPCQKVYVGDQHQQIYEWRGAVNALAKTETLRNVALTRSFRFGQSIANAANRALVRLGESRRVEGNPGVSSRVGVGFGDATPASATVLARSNGAVLAEVLDVIDGGGVPHIAGGTKDIKTLIHGVYELRDHQTSNVPEFYGFRSWEAVVAHSESEFGRDLATFVGLVERRGIGCLHHTLKKVVPEPEAATVTVSTAHKAKGREWDHVRLTDDFVPPNRDANGVEGPPLDAEMRLLYVAMTRARRGLDVGQTAFRALAD